MKHDSVYNILAQRFAAAVGEVAGVPAGQIDPALRPATDPKFGDYQCNVAMSLARPLKAKPRDIAQRIKDAVEPGLADIAEPLELAGPGFLNIRLKNDFLAAYLGEIAAPPAAGATGIGDLGSGTGVESSGFRVQGSGFRVQGSGEGPPPSSPSHVPTSPRSHAALDRVGLTPVDRPIRVVVEYSQPNIAKQMHVGHLRGTVIGDVFARVLDFEGHEVIRQNHIGDWGTQFGMLIRWYRDNPLPTPDTHADVLEAIEDDYKTANERFKSDEQWATEARQAVTELQGGDPDAYHLWEQICRISLDAIDDLYARLGVLLQPSDVRGESFYNDRLQPLVDELRRLLPLRDAAARNHGTGDQGSGIGDKGSGFRVQGSGQETPPSSRSHVPTPTAEVKDDQGAVCVFLCDQAGQPLFKKPDGEILPLIIQKSDGAFLYATTDLAAIRYRLQELEFPSGVGARRVIYVTDARQKLHFDMWMAAAGAAGWISPDLSVEHVTFGTVLGSDRRPLKTRDGGTIKLRELLDEAETRALELLRKRAAESNEVDQGGQTRDADEELSESEMRRIASAVGVAAIKYADLRNDRNSDYVFSWDKMISLQGNTAPYMMYAYARIRSIYRRAAERFGSPDVYAPQVGIRLVEPAERMLALKLGRLREAIDAVAADLTPHTLCAYLYEVASEFMRFYESCPVLAAPDESTRLSRMRLCDLTARTLKLGLGLLGIDVIERM